MNMDKVNTMYKYEIFCLVILFFDAMMEIRNQVHYSCKYFHTYSLKYKVIKYLTKFDHNLPFRSWSKKYYRKKYVILFQLTSFVGTPFVIKLNIIPN